ncbi:FAD-binding oxidoreductase [Streptomyces sp. ISL-96]|uniref:FAD-binding oxidoreductase n=1 Tax=Streptomyces sp. ISL-96 TaxID=2819191 RepID=UPI001BE699BF|nr:FAD-binding oxidoreductase [Streptomyces sp. ISL-96]MBT2488881.1 FAD-binding oxidoreductase [Streptomyces sp. ISL-96]
MERRTFLTSATALAATTTAAACTGTTTGTTTGTGHGSTARTAATATSTTPTPTPTWTALARSLEGPLIRPEDAAYKTARQLYNTRFDNLKPAAVAYVANEADVKECLAFAKTHRTQVAIRNGGHSYAGWSTGTGRLVIDVSKLAQVKATGTAATIGAGAKLIDVYQSLARQGGRTIPAGSCPTVGISGLTLGGGHGVVSRAYGLTCDSLTSATLITAAGERLRCTPTEHPDLFWALRGAGNGNFGVVTELTFRTHPAPAAVTAFLSWPWAKAQAVITAWQEWGPDQPDEIWSSAHLAAGPGGVTPTVSISAFSLGGYTELQNAVDRLADKIGAPARSVSLRRRSYQESMLVYAGCAGFSDAQCHLPGTTPGRTPQGALGRETYAARSDFFDRSLSPAGVRALLAQTEAFTRIPVSRDGGGGSIALTALGGAVNRVDPLATAFVHRRQRMLAQYIGAWRAGTSGTAQQTWLKNAHGAMRRYASGAAYQNYTDATLTDWRKAYYGAAADRLTTLKKHYDPDRLFDFPQAL